MNIDYNNCRLQHFRSFQRLKKLLNNIPKGHLYINNEAESLPDLIDRLDFSMFAIMASHMLDNEEFKDMSEHLGDKIEFNNLPYQNLYQ